MMVLEQPVKKLHDFFTLDNIPITKTALDCRSLPALSLATSTTGAASAAQNSSPARNLESFLPASSTRLKPTTVRAFPAKGNFHASMPNLRFNMDDESDSDFSEIEWSKHNTDKAPRQKGLQHHLERQAPAPTAALTSNNKMSRSVCTSGTKSSASVSADSSRSEAKKKKILKVRASDLSKLPTRLRDSVTSKSSSSADDQSCGFSVISKNSRMTALAPSKKDKGRSHSIERRPTLDHGAPVGRGVGRQYSLGGAAVVPSRAPNTRGVLRQQSTSAVPSRTASVTPYASRGRSVDRVGAPSNPQLRPVPVSSCVKPEPEANKAGHDPWNSHIRARNRSLNHSNLFMSNVLTDRLWASADNLNFDPASLDDLLASSHHGDAAATSLGSPRRGVRRSQSDDILTQGLGAPLRRGLRRSRSIDGCNYPTPLSISTPAPVARKNTNGSPSTSPLTHRARRCRSVDCRRTDVVAGERISPTTKRTADDTPRHPRSKSVDMRRIMKESPVSNQKSVSEAGREVAEKSRSHSRGRRSHREESRRSHSNARPTRKEDSDKHRSSRSDRDEKPSRPSRSKSRSASMRGSASKSSSREKSRDSRSRRQSSKSSLSNTHPSRESPPSREGHSLRSKSTSRTCQPSDGSTKSSPVSQTLSPVAILQKLADAPSLDISPRKRLHRHLGQHHVPHKKSSSSEVNSLTSGSTVSRTSRLSNPSQATSSTSSSTYESTELTPGALSRIRDLGITPEQIALLNKMGLKISEKPQS